MRNNIYFDLLCAQPFGKIKFHGGGEYTKAVFKKLTEVYREEEAKLFVFLDTSKFIDDWIKDVINEKGLEVIHTQSYHEIADYINSLDDCHRSTFYTGLINQYENIYITDKVRTIGTCHGLRQLEKNYDVTEYWYANNIKDIVRSFLNHVKRNNNYKRSFNQYKNCLSKFQYIVTVSRHSQYAIKSTFGGILRQKNIMTLYTPSKVFTISQQYPQDGRYIMMVSADRWIKNAYRGVLAIDKLYSQNVLSDMKTKIYGNLPWLIRARIKNKEKFEFYGYVSSEELEEAYSNCSVFFYPSLNEGFGMPPIEAQKYGKTCVISAVASLTEIYSDSAYYCNPYDVMEMTTRLLEAIDCKIDTDVIADNLKKITEKQSNDLTTLALLILS